MEICAGPDADDAFAAGEEDAPVVDLGLTTCLDSAGCGEVAGQVEGAVVVLEPAVAADLVKVADFLVLISVGSGAVGHCEQADSGWIAAAAAGQEDGDAAGYEADGSSLEAGRTGFAAAVGKFDTAELSVLGDS